MLKIKENNEIVLIVKDDLDRTYGYGKQTEKVMVCGIPKLQEYGRRFG